MFHLLCDYPGLFGGCESCPEMMWTMALRFCTFSAIPFFQLLFSPIIVCERHKLSLHFFRVMTVFPPVFQYV